METTTLHILKRVTSETLILLTIVLMTQSCHCRCYHGAQCLMIRGDQHAPKYLTNSEPLYFWDTTDCHKVWPIWVLCFRNNIYKIKATTWFTNMCSYNERKLVLNIYQKQVTSWMKWHSCCCCHEFALLCFSCISCFCGALVMWWRYVPNKPTSNSCFAFPETIKCLKMDVFLWNHEDLWGFFGVYVPFWNIKIACCEVKSCMVLFTLIQRLFSLPLSNVWIYYSFKGII